MAEAGHVIASPTVPAGQRDRLPPDVADLLGFVGGYASEHPDQRLIWFTDVTRWLEWEKDSSWSALGVDWEHPLAQLTRPPCGHDRVTPGSRRLMYARAASLSTSNCS